MHTDQPPPAESRRPGRHPRPRTQPTRPRPPPPPGLSTRPISTRPRPGPQHRGTRPASDHDPTVYSASMPWRVPGRSAGVAAVGRCAARLGQWLGSRCTDRGPTTRPHPQATTDPAQDCKISTQTPHRRRHPPPRANSRREPQKQPAERVPDPPRPLPRNPEPNHTPTRTERSHARQALNRQPAQAQPPPGPRPQPASGPCWPARYSGHTSRASNRSPSDNGTSPHNRSG